MSEGRSIVASGVALLTELPPLRPPEEDAGAVECYVAPRRVRDPARLPGMTVVLLSYNQAPYLSQAIAGALAQDHEPLDILISDDASTDASQAVILDAVAAYRGPHRLTLNFNAVNLGLVRHVNRVFAMVRTPWLVMAAGDDVSLPHRVRAIAEAVCDHPGTALAVYSDGETIDAAGAHTGYLHNGRERNRLDAASMARGGTYINGATAAWARMLVEEFGPLDPQAAAEDSILPFRAALLGEILHLQAPLILRRLHPASLSGGVGREGLRRSMAPLVDAYAARLADLRHPRVEARFGAATVAAMAAAVRDTVENVRIELDVLDRRPQAIGRLLRHVGRGGIAWLPALKMLLIHRTPALWRAYARLSARFARSPGRRR